MFGVTFLAISLVSGDFFVTTASVYYGETDIALGGILGSTIFCLTLPLAATILGNREGVRFFFFSEDSWIF
jgi:Ca2+/Na+ antiporter